MKTLAIQKINDKREDLLSRARHNRKRYEKKEINLDQLLDCYIRCEGEYIGFIDAVIKLGLITDNELQLELESFLLELSSIRWNRNRG